MRKQLKEVKFRGSESRISRERSVQVEDRTGTVVPKCKSEGGNGLGQQQKEPIKSELRKFDVKI